MNKGFGLLEIVIASTILSTGIFGIFSVAVLSNRLNSQSLEKMRANFLAEEGLEVTRFLRDESWLDNLSNLIHGNTYYISFNEAGSLWTIGSEIVSNIDSLFERKIFVEKVYRDSNDNIVLSGGAEDLNSRKIIIEISWQENNATTTLQLSEYLSNIFNN